MSHEQFWVVLDIETTGLNPLYDDIIEICAVKLTTDYIIQTEFYSLITIDRCLPALITKLTGITEKDLREHGRPPDKVFLEFETFIHDSILVGHNIDDFDLKFLRRAFEKIGRSLENQTYDTLKKAKELFRFYSYKLEELAASMNIKTGKLHDARNDVMVTIEIFKHLRAAET